MPSLALNDRTLVHVDGTEAEHFLQNLITANVETLEPGEARPSALLTPQGKILFDFLISRAPQGGFRLDIRAEIAGDFLRRLTLYKLRAQVTFTTGTDLPVVAGWDDDAPRDAFRDARFPASARCWRFYGTAPQTVTGRAEWDAHRIDHGVAESGSDFELSDVFPHDILMDRTTGVDFRKGCYVGQEVVSRMHHRGTARKRPMIVRASAALPDAGTPVLADAKPAGVLGTVVADKALAIVRTDRVEDAVAKGAPLLAGDVTVTLAFPDWTGLAFSGAAATKADA